LGTDDAIAIQGFVNGMQKATMGSSACRGSGNSDTFRHLSGSGRSRMVANFTQGNFPKERHQAPQENGVFWSTAAYREVSFVCSLY
jgi:hypothetical protein